MSRPFTRIEDRQQERRGSSRRRTLLAAKLSFSKPGLIVGCGIRNMSADGALIELDSSTLLQPPFQLLTMRDGTVYEADLVWSWNRLVGLRFTAEHPVYAPPNDEVRMLRAIWAATRA